MCPHHKEGESLIHTGPDWNKKLASLTLAREQCSSPSSDNDRTRGGQQAGNGGGGGGLRILHSAQGILSPKLSQHPAKG